ncbi:MAG: serine/threonine-protein kinase [Acidobacteriota bacterium]
MIEYEADAAEATVVDRGGRLLGVVLDGRYRIEDKLAEGGFGIVYRATHLPSGADVAVKVLHAELTRDPDVVARFRREGAVLARLRDPHTVAAYDIGEVDGLLYIAMELLRGENLHDRFTARGALPWPEVVTIAREVCSSLAEAHALGIVHRDLKPSNIYLEQGGFVKVIDFGIAKLHEGSALASIEVTRQGQMIGTFDYMSPEQIIGGPCGPASDLYTLGVVMYELIAGVRPFPDEKGPASMLTALLTKTPPPLSCRRAVPDELEAVVMRCLEREPQQRFASVDELAAALDRLAGDPADREITRVVPYPLPQPQLPLPRLPAAGFEARGSEPGIAPAPFDTTLELRHQRLVRRVAIAFAVVVTLLIAAAVLVS